MHIFCNAPGPEAYYAIKDSFIQLNECGEVQNLYAGRKNKHMYKVHIQLVRETQTHLYTSIYIYIYTTYPRIYLTISDIHNSDIAVTNVKCNIFLFTPCKTHVFYIYILYEL